MTDDTPSPLSNVITIDDERIKSHLDRVVRGSVERHVPSTKVGEVAAMLKAIYASDASRLRARRLQMKKTGHGVRERGPGTPVVAVAEPVVFLETPGHAFSVDVELEPFRKFLWRPEQSPLELIPPELLSPSDGAAADEDRRRHVMLFENGPSVCQIVEITVVESHRDRIFRNTVRCVSANQFAQRAGVRDPAKHFHVLREVFRRYAERP